MREGWEIKKLGEIGTIVGGSTPKTNIPEYWGEGYPWITPAELNGSKYVNATERTITEEALKHTNLTLLPVGSVLLSSRAPIGKVAITAIPLYCNQGFKNIVCGPGINNEYVYWFLIHRKEYLISLGRGATFKEISKHIVEQVPILVPPVQEQEKIVAELDCLSGIIEKKKEQLKELDNLAQSIFYDMFGDPITNEKGWDKAKMEDVCKSMTKGPFGSDIKKTLYVPKSADTYKVYIQANAIEKDISLGDYYISKQYFNEKMHRFEVHPGDYIITCDGTLGKYIRLPEEIERGIISASLLRITLNERITTSFFEAIWDNFVLRTLSKDIRNTALVHLPAASKIGKVHIPLPSLDLQNAFARKIEAIEKQKELIKQSIVETETLFNSRMDYWFN